MPEPLLSLHAVLEPAAETRLVLGCMTGTSLDALDVAGVVITGHGLVMRARVAGGLTRELGPLAPRLRALAEGRPHTAREISELALDFGALHGEACAVLADELAPEYGRPVLAVLHGQTVFHAPPLSWQMINPWPVARRLGPGCRVVTDLRGADLAHGGQGAPITPVADWVLFRSDTEGRAVVNLGGYCNITLIPSGRGPESVHGRDVCACNHLLDAAARLALGLDFDPSGENASKGLPDDGARAELARTLRGQAGAGRSLGSGDEATLWVRRWHGMLSGPDLLASCVAALAEVIAEAVSGVSRVIVAGGGAHNSALMEALARRSLGVVQRSDQLAAPDHAVPISMREAAEMGVLGALSMDGVPITLPSVTGVPAPAPNAGAWYGAAVESVGQASGPPSPIAAGVRAPTATFPPSAPPDRSWVLTEQRNPRTEHLDELDALGLVRALNDEDAQVAAAVRGAEREIAAFIDDLEARMRGAPYPGTTGFDWHSAGRPRLIYIGAGTSGRLGVLDASECPPTFQVEPGMVVGVIAGGDASLRRSSESREDEPDGALPDLDALRIGPRDTLLGIAAGGTTPYVLGAIRIARERGALTGLLSCAPLRSPSAAHHHIVVATGPEAVTGSTRLKAGTATKLVLNTISTALMVRLGKVHGNLMVDLRASNDKLRDRAARIVSALTGLGREDALRALADAGGNPKVAAVMCLRGLPRSSAEELLAHHGGRLRGALINPHPQSTSDS